MNGKSFIPKVLGWYTRLKHFPILDMLRVEHFSKKKFLVLDNPGRNARRGALFLVKMGRRSLQDCFRP